MKKLQRLPIGKSSFERIRENNDLYVDKTRQIYKMADEGEYYFLSRPCRFGKSLTVSTLRCLFQGRRELFEGLWIAENTDWEWKEHPVILLDFNSITHDTPENLKAGIGKCLGDMALENGIQLHSPFLKMRLAELILGLYRKTGIRVVILIDDYDHPVTGHLGKGKKEFEIAKANQEIIGSFLVALKSGDVADVLQFVYITGGIRLSPVFWELNNLNNISMDRNHSDINDLPRKSLMSFLPDIWNSLLNKKERLRFR